MKRIPFLVLIAALLFWPSFTSSQAAQHGVFLTWPIPAGDATHSVPASFNVYRATVSGGPYTLVTNVTTASYVDPITILTAGTTYFYVIRSVNSVGSEDGASNEVTAIIPNPPAPVIGAQGVVR
jgi:hypothetical protein